MQDRFLLRMDPCLLAAKSLCWSKERGAQVIQEDLDSHLDQASTVSAGWADFTPHHLLKCGKCACTYGSPF